MNRPEAEFPMDVKDYRSLEKYCDWIEGEFEEMAELMVDTIDDHVKLEKQVIELKEFLYEMSLTGHIYSGYEDKYRKLYNK